MPQIKSVHIAHWTKLAAQEFTADLPEDPRIVRIFEQSGGVRLSYVEPEPSPGKGHDLYLYRLLFVTDGQRYPDGYQYLGTFTTPRRVILHLVGFPTKLRNLVKPS